ncbi:TerB family tellurite resistance protein [Robiginitalea sp. IMCC43444]|uniref:TerB family tellurite resistance protein n=1 Tax=Robiginitalea sp. IMCC43444 TaxID=3459121 RepID=UPI00404121C6
MELLKNKAMVDFNLAEKLAIIKAIDEVLTIDDRIYEGEVFFIRQLSSILKIEMDMIREARKIDATQAMGILRALPEHKKNTLARLLNEAANADGKVAEQEIRLIYRILSDIGVEVDYL